MKPFHNHKDLSIDSLKEISTWVSFAHDLNQLLELILETGTGPQGIWMKSNHRHEKR